MTLETLVVKKLETDELSVEIYRDNSMFLTCSHYLKIGVGTSTRPDLMTISGDDARALYETLKEHFEGDKTDGR